jgi:cis-L-3-hydroxyproline dehydratase
VRIVGVRGYRQFQPFRDGLYGTAGGSAAGWESVVVAIDTDEGLVGWGEMAPLGSFYSPAFAAGARAGVAELAPHLLDADPTQTSAITALLDGAMRGQPYVKSALDMACWDLKAKAARQPLSVATGGRFGSAVPLYHAIPPDRPETMSARAATLVKEGYRRLQVKVGRDPREDHQRVIAVRDAVGSHVELFVDANGAWTTRQALGFLRLSRDLAITVEQPCATYAECRAVRPHCPHPMVLDESIDSLDALLSARADQVADGVTIKLSRVGGITRALLIRDVAVELNMGVTIEDTGGASIDTAAIVQLSMSTPERLRTHTCNFTAWVTVDNARGMPTPANGCLSPPDGDGLGVDVLEGELGDPFVSVGRGETRA